MSIELRPIHSGRVRGDGGEGRARDRGGSDPSRRVGRGGEGGGAMRSSDGWMDGRALSDTVTMNVVYYQLKMRSKLHLLVVFVPIKPHVSMTLSNG